VFVAPFSSPTQRRKLNRREDVMPASETLRLPRLPATQPAISAYRQRVLSLRPVGYWRLGETNGRIAFDSAGRGHGAYRGVPALGQPGAIHNDADKAVGLLRGSYVEVPTRSEYGVTGTGLTVEAWVRPDRLDFTGETSEAYVHWLGKGEAGRLEWGFRFYSKATNRPNRISAYIWNAIGGEGAGAYVQEPVVPGEWIHIVAVYQPPGKGAGVAIYKNGVFKKGPPDTPTLYSSYEVTPTPGAAPLRLGTRDLKSFLTGGLDEVAIYPRCLSGGDILGNYRVATTGPRNILEPP
jgi:hypothetical protein